jgi:hypothetical protein
MQQESVRVVLLAALIAILSIPKKLPLALLVILQPNLTTRLSNASFLAMGQLYSTIIRILAKAAPTESILTQLGMTAEHVLRVIVPLAT